MNIHEARQVIMQIESDGNPYGGSCPAGWTNFDGSLTETGQKLWDEAKKVIAEYEKEKT